MDDVLGGMMRSACAVSWFAIAFFGIACGGSPPPAPAPPPAVAAPALAVAAPDLSEAPEPSHLVGVLRWKSPEATLKTVYEWTGVRLNAAELAAEGLDKNLAATLALDAPVDGAMSLDDRGGDALTPIFAVSVGVRSVEAARTAAQILGTVTEVGPGTYKVNLRHRKRKGDKPFCILSAAVGSAPGRFVCGQRERDVDTLRPYLTRTLPKKDLGSADLHVELRMAPVMDVYGPAINQGLRMGAALAPRKLQIGEPTFDRAIERLASGMSEELGAVVQDIDSMKFDLTMAPDKASATGSLRLKGQQSWTAGTFVSAAARSSTPPSMFWHLPATATSAYYATTPEARRYEVIRRTISDLLDGWLQHEGFAAADRTPITALLGEKFLLDSPWVVASGPFAAEPPKAGAKPPAPPSDPVEAALAKSGWYLAGIGAPFPTSDFVKSMATAVNRPKLQAYLKSKLAGALGDDGVLVDARGPAKDAAKGLSGITMKSVPVPKELPKGSLAFELALLREAAVPDPKTKKKPAPAKLYILVAPEAEQTWVALGGDKALLIKPLLAATQGGPESGTLASRQDIGTLRQLKVTAAGFTTLEGLLHSWSAPATWVDAGAARTAGDVQTLIATTPNKGKTPILSTDEIKTGDGITWTLSVDVPKGVIEDTVILAASSGLSALPRR